MTEKGVNHRKLTESGHTDALLDFAVQALRTHHISPESLERRRKVIESLQTGAEIQQISPYPHNIKTQKGNFAEVILAEYILSSSETQLPIYRLRYNTNIEQSMKGDDILLFDLDSDPVRIIVAESKFRKKPSKQVIAESIDGLVRSHKNGLAVSLMFVAERLFDEGKREVGEKVQNCACIFFADKLQIDYIGFLLSDTKAGEFVDKHTTNELHNLLMISLGMLSPEDIVKDAFSRLEQSL